MRDIKFRVWCKQQEEMFIVEKMGFFSNGDFWYAEDKDRKLQPPYFYDDTDFELMQYTGLKDKNGVECYEGDIVEIYGGFKYEVKFADGSFRFGDYLDKTSYLDSDTFKIIGNIYENPKLLKGELKMKLIYVSDKMVDFMIRQYPKLKEQDIYEIVSVSKIKTEQKMDFLHETKNIYTLECNYIMEIPDFFSRKFALDSKIPFIADENGILYKVMEIPKS